MNFDQLEFNIAKWHRERNLIGGSNDEAQFLKLLEEVIELYLEIFDIGEQEAWDYFHCLTDNLGSVGKFERNPDNSIADAIGDINVVLANIAERNALTLSGCIEHAWHEIKDRKGKMVGGVFVKEEDL